MSKAALERLPKVGPMRAGRLLSSFIAAAPTLELCELLVEAGLDVRLGRPRGRRVRPGRGPAPARRPVVDPEPCPTWTCATADRLARAAVPGVRIDDPRRGRALVGWVLSERARDGHTVHEAVAVARSLRDLGWADPGAAVRGAVDDESVLPAVANADADGEPAALLALTRYGQRRGGDRREHRPPGRPRPGRSPASRQRCRARWPTSTNASATR